MTVIDFENRDYFLRLKDLFEKNIDKFTDNEKTSWITILSNYCTLKSNKGENHYREYLFEINKLELQVGFSNNNKNPSKIFFHPGFKKCSFYQQN